MNCKGICSLIFNRFNIGPKERNSNRDHRKIELAVLSCPKHGPSDRDGEVMIARLNPTIEILYYDILMYISYIHTL